MSGYRFGAHQDHQSDPFRSFFELFRQLLTYTSGDVSEALSWLNELDREYKLSRNGYGMGDFIRELQEKGYLKESESGGFKITPKTEQSIRSGALEMIFGKLRKSGRGEHRTSKTGLGEQNSGDIQQYTFGDSIERIAVTESLLNSARQSQNGEIHLREEDLLVHSQEHHSQTSTVLMIDISHSMILYGEDRITPAKNVAMALVELIRRKYPKDTIDIVTFGDEANMIGIKDLPYLQVGPYHTNTVAGLELAMDLLRRKKTANRQIFMITDGKPSCMFQNGMLYKNSFGLDRKITGRCLQLAAACKRVGIGITTFMIARDPYLQEFVDEFSRANNGKAYYTSLEGLGNYLFEDFEKNRKRKIR